MRYVFNIYGRKYVRNWMPEDIVKNVSEMVIRYKWWNKRFDDNYSLEDFMQEVYNRCTGNEIQVLVDVRLPPISMKTPKEVRFLGKKRINMISSDVYMDIVTLPFIERKLYA